MRKSRLKVLIGALVVFGVGTIGLSLPSVWSRVSYYVRQAYADVYYFFRRPEQSVFIPSESNPGFVATSVQATMNALNPMVTPTVSTPVSTQIPTPTPMPLPSSVYLDGVIPEPQMWNNCGPATLSMYLSYYHWGKTQVDTAAVLKPDQEDKNVMPYEMVNFVNEYTNLRAISRVGGDLYTLKALVSAGYPMMVEKGFEVENKGWMGHYNLVIGYDDAKAVFTTQDSYLLVHKEDIDTIPGFSVTYDDMEKNWRAFDYIFIVVYPADKGNDVLNILGSLADETTANQIAYDRAVSETQTLTEPREKYFAWYNVGTSLVGLGDYQGAASAYDTAFSVYPNIAVDLRPSRMLWYQTGPYFAYYHSGRYQDVISLADKTIEDVAQHNLEESYVWRARAKLATGDQKGAIADLRESLKFHEGFAPSIDLLNQLGVTP